MGIISNTIKSQKGLSKNSSKLLPSKLLMGKLSILRDMQEIKIIHLSIWITTDQWIPWAIQNDFLLLPELHHPFGLVPWQALYLGPRKFMSKVSKALDLSHWFPWALVSSLLLQSPAPFMGKQEVPERNQGGRSIHFPPREQNFVT